MATEREEWRAVPGFEGRYDVSSFGRVRSLRFRNRIIDKPRLVPLIMTPEQCRKQRLRVHLGRGNRVSVHRLVLLAFVGPCPSDKNECAHLNGNPLDNRVENLVWATHSENNNMKVGHGTMPQGPQILASRLTTPQVREVRARLTQGDSCGQIAKDFGVSPRTITAINHGETWRWLGPAPNAEYTPAVLTWDAVRRIRRRWSRGGVTQAQLAREYGVNHGTIHCVVKNKTWRNAQRVLQEAQDE